MHLKKIKVLAYSLILLSLELFSCPVMGQETALKNLTIEDYDRWESLSALDLSDDGKWVSYRMFRENISDSVWIRNIQSGFQKAFTNVSNWHFVGENYFIAKQGNILMIFDLKKKLKY